MSPGMDRLRTPCRAVLGPGGTLAGGYLHAQHRGRSRCPLAQLPGTLPGAAAAGSETTPATMTLQCWPQHAGKSAGLLAAPLPAEWRCPGSPWSTLSPRAPSQGHAAITSFPWEAQPQVPFVASPSPKASSPRERGSLGPPAAPAREMGPRPAAAASDGRYSYAAPEMRRLEKSRANLIAADTSARGA